MSADWRDCLCLSADWKDEEGGGGGAYPLVNVSVLQLDKSGADGSDVALLIGEGHTPRPLGILELWVGVNAGVTHTSVQTIHNHGQLHWRGRGGRGMGEGGRAREGGRGKRERERESVRLNVGIGLWQCDR